MKLTKKGRTLMTFVKVSGNPTRQQTEELTKVWQTSLWNNHIPVERLKIIFYVATTTICLVKEGVCHFGAFVCVVCHEIILVIICNFLYPTNKRYEICASTFI